MWPQKRLRRGPVHARAVAALTTAAVACALAGAGTASAQTVVSLGFDDGYTSQYDVRPMLASHGMHGTFFMISGNVGTSGFMTWSQLAALQADGNEIGGHTVNHVDLSTVSAAVAHQEVCDDRAALQAHGLTVTNFAYPYGGFNAQAEQAAQDCGYDSARTTGWFGFTCPFPCTESIPPRDPFATTVAGFSDQTLPELQTVVTNAEVAGGWAQIVIHQICDSGCAISPSTFDAFLDWLASRVAVGALSVRTVRDVMSTPATPPDTSIIAGPSGVTKAVSPSFAFTSDASPGVTFSCRLDGPGSATGSWGVCTSPKGYASLADGSYTFRVRAISAAGSDQTPAARSFTVDTTAPAAPAIGTPAQNDWTASSTVVVSGTAEAASTVEVFDGATSAGTAQADDSGSWSTTLSGLAGGAHVLRAKASDAAGNTSAASASRTVNVDMVAPQAAIAAPVEGARLRLGQVVLADYACSDGSLKTCAGPVATGAAIDTATPGAKTFTVQAADHAGNTTSVTAHYVVDATAPQITITAPADGARYPRGASVPAGWACSDDDGTSDIDMSPAATFGTQAPGAAIGTASLGPKTFSVTCTDLAGNVTTKSAEYTVTDPSPPDIAVEVPADGAQYERGQVVPADYACRDEDGGSGVGTCAGTAAPGAAIDTSTPGRKTFTVDAEDREGNRAARTVHYIVVGNAPAAVQPGPPAPQTTGPPATTVRMARLQSIRAAARGALRLTFQIPSAGVLVVSASTTTAGAARPLTYAKVRRTVAAGTVQVTLTPSRAARRLLQRSGQLRLGIRSVFTPRRGGTATVVLRTATVKD